MTRLLLALHYYMKSSKEIELVFVETIEVGYIIEAYIYNINSRLTQQNDL